MKSPAGSAHSDDRLAARAPACIPPLRKDLASRPVVSGKASFTGLNGVIGTRGRRIQGQLGDPRRATAPGTSPEPLPENGDARDGGVVLRR